MPRNSSTHVVCVYTSCAVNGNLIGWKPFEQIKTLGPHTTAAGRMVNQLFLKGKRLAGGVAHYRDRPMCVDSNNVAFPV
jgi:hypothetical protein